jgi:hypothetical protein
LSAGAPYTPASIAAKSSRCLRVSTSVAVMAEHEAIAAAVER